MDNTFANPSVLSFCPGILGIERGLEAAGTSCRVVAYVEIESFIIANLVAGMESGVLGPAPIWTDANTFDARPFRGKVHGIIGGYPCPGESLAGLREGHLYEGFIWPAIRRAINAARPLFCFFENVDDHLTGTYPIVLRSLQNMGYRVEAGIFSAEEVGAPHERQRLFILAVADTCFSDGKAGREYTRWKEGNKYESCCQQLGITECEPLNKGRRRIRGKSDSTGNHVVNSGSVTGRKDSEGGLGVDGNLLQETEREESSNGVGSTGSPQTELGNTQGQRSQGHRTEGKQQSDNATESTVSNGTGRGILWPAGQGPEQYEWEHPRTIEPSLGCTIDGYNFRNDLLRALGNSVVEQTASLAWITLLRKHFPQL